MYPIKYEKITPSIRSNNPPWPGNIFPVSFIFCFLLKKEIIKSPIWFIVEIKNMIKKDENEKVPSKRKLLKKYKYEIPNIFENK